MFSRPRLRPAILTLFILIFALSACELPSPSGGTVQDVPDTQAVDVTTDTATDTVDDTTSDDSAEAAGEELRGGEDATETEDTSTENEAADTSDAAADEAADAAPETDETTEDTDDTTTDTEEVADSTSDTTDTDTATDAEGDTEVAEADETEESAADADSEMSDDNEETADTEEAATESTDSDADDSASDSESTADSESSTTTSDTPGTHIVAAGENLYRIGLQYGVSWVTLAQVNGLANANAIVVGQELRIPGSAGDEAATPTPSATDETTYTVKAGDNLFQIGLAFGIGWIQIAEANGLVNPNNISVGQVLKIPANTPGPTPEFTHVVRPGETLTTIGLRYGISWLAIAEKNELESPYVIYTGQALVIPGG